ncbi:HNH endonuclease [Candidatus Saccharibacteria bacterium]|nr:HNH endonuclease [Candidatus Saccharibacteria bacterium]
MKLKSRRLIGVIIALVAVMAWLVMNPESYEKIFVRSEGVSAENLGGEGGAGVVTNDTGDGRPATEILDELEVKGRAPKTGYSREEFYNGWPTVDGCSLRQRIIRREFGETAVLNGCDVLAGEFEEPYTGQYLIFSEKAEISKGIQIDHVVALSDAWQKGAQYMEKTVRYAMATDPLNLLAVDATANGKKSDGDAATWLPPNKKFRCQYVARQVSVKYKYGLWVTEAEKTAISSVLESCPGQKAVGV